MRHGDWLDLACGWWVFIGLVLSGNLVSRGTYLVVLEFLVAGSGSSAATTPCDVDLSWHESDGACTMDLELSGIVSYCYYYSVATTNSHSRKTHCLRCPRVNRVGPLCLLIWGNLISTYLMHAPDLHWGDTRSRPRSQLAHAPVDSGHAAPFTQAMQTAATFRLSQPLQPPGTWHGTIWMCKDGGP